MKGIILAGGSGTRLYPITLGLSKQLLPVYDKPMIYYPLSMLMLAGIREILIITTPHDQPQFQALLGDGSQFGVELAYAVQPKPEGLAQAFIIGADFVGERSLSRWSSATTSSTATACPRCCSGARPGRAGATVFAYQVADPSATASSRSTPSGGDQPSRRSRRQPKSNWAVTGLYFYDNEVLDIAAAIKPSARGELEITDVNRCYLERRQAAGRAHGPRLCLARHRHADSLLEAAQFVATLEHRQGMKIACPEEIALRYGFTTVKQMEPWLSRLGKSDYAAYVRRVATDLA